MLYKLWRISTKIILRVNYLLSVKPLFSIFDDFIIIILLQIQLTRLSKHFQKPLCVLKHEEQMAILIQVDKG